MDTTGALLISTIVICAVVLDATRGIKHDLARIKCELTGHWHAEFKKYGEEAHCPRCKHVIATRALGSDGVGMQFGEDTLHQRVLRLEEALGVDDVPLIARPNIPKKD